MGWKIKCLDANCPKETWASNIVDLINNHRDAEGWFLCTCGSHGYIVKSFDLQEEGEVWEPYLRGIITLGDPEESYQPFVFIVSYAPESQCDNLWFSYYKDLRKSGGNLKLGYGPGGPPVLNKSTIKLLLKNLKQVGFFSTSDIEELVSNSD